MPKMSTRKRLIYHADRAKLAVERCIAQLHSIDVVADGKNPTVSDSLDSLVLMGITYINVLTKFRGAL